jgi:hypothetical protein
LASKAARLGGLCILMEIADPKLQLR